MTSISTGYRRLRKPVFVPFNLVHASLPAEAWFGIRQRSTKDNNGVIDTTRGSMQNLFRNESPTVDLVCDGRRDGSSPLMRNVNMTRIGLGGLAGWCRDRRDLNALV